MLLGRHWDQPNRRLLRHRKIRGVSNTQLEPEEATKKTAIIANPRALVYLGGFLQLLRQ